jgi:4-carboxymuconolactone decarboxylase
MTERYRLHDPATLDAERRAIYDAIAAGPRGSVPAIFHLLLEAPAVAGKAQALGAELRYRTSLGPKLSELAILVTAHHWGADYEWAIHAPEAAKAGLAAAVIDAIAAGQTPETDEADVRLVHDVARSLLDTHAVPDALFAEALDRFGRQALVELTAVIGYYSMLAIAIRCFQLPGHEPAPAKMT